MFEKLVLGLGQQVADAVANGGDNVVEATTDAQKTIATWTQISDSPIINSIMGYTVSIVGALVLFIVGLILAKCLKNFAVKASKKGLRDDGTSPLPKFIGNVVYYLIVVIIVLACLSIFGIQTTSFAAILAAAGLAIGLAFQGTLSNLAAGVMLIVFHPFKLGDYINGAGQSGTVSEIGLFTTTIVTVDNRIITVPNSALSGATIDNCSQPFRRADVNVAVAYSADLDSTRAALERAMNVEGAILDDGEHKSFVYLLDVTPGGIANYQVRTWCKGADYWAVRERVTAQVKRELDRNGAAITSTGLRRADVAVGVAYEADLDATRKALEAACKVEGVLEDPAPSVVLTDLGDSSVNYSLRCWCKGTDYWAVMERVTIQAKRELDKANIEIPFPQVTISNKQA